MNKLMLGILSVFLMSASVVAVSASAWNVNVGYVLHSDDWDNESPVWMEVPSSKVKGNSFIYDLNMNKVLRFYEVPPSRDSYGRQTSSGGQIYYTFADGVTRQGFFDVIDVQAASVLNPPTPKMITQEFKVHPTGKTYQNSIPGYYTGRDIGAPEPYLFSEKPMKLEAQPNNEIVVLPMGGGGGGPLPTLDK